MHRLHVIANDCRNSTGLAVNFTAIEDLLKHDDCKREYRHRTQNF